MKFKKDPLKFQKVKKSYKEHSNKKVIENGPPPKVDILILNTIFKFSKVKNKTPKRPPKVSKNPKQI